MELGNSGAGEGAVSCSAPEVIVITFACIKSGEHIDLKESNCTKYGDSQYIPILFGDR